MPQRQPSPSLRASRRRLFRGGVLLVVLAAAWGTFKLINAIARLQDYDVTTDIAYADGGRRKLDVYRPRDAANAPVIVFFYGGSWQSGSKRLYRFLAATLVAQGCVVVVPDYRLYPEVKYPDFLIDGAQALRWVHDNIATFHGDPRRLFVMGHSAGAYIAAMLALDDEWLEQVDLDPNRDIAGLIGVSGPYDFLPLRDGVLATTFGGADRPDTQPIAHARGRKPPALLVTGGADRTVDPGNSTRLAAQLRGSGNDVTEMIYPRFGHMTILAAFAPILATLFPVLHDLDSFVDRIPAQVPQPAATGAGAIAP